MTQRHLASIRPSAAFSAALKEALEAKSDWYVTCPRCHEKIVGKPTELVHHCAAVKDRFPLVGT